MELEHEQMEYKPKEHRVSCVRCGKSILDTDSKCKWCKLDLKDIYYTHPKIFKQSGIYLQNQCECTPIYFNNELLTVTFGRQDANGIHILIHKLETRELVQKIPWSYGLGCAIVIGNKIYVYGSSNWSARNHIAMMIIDKDFNTNKFKANSPVPVIEATENQKIFNSSVTPCPEGFIMAYEVDEKGYTAFSIRFAISKDLEHWKPIGTIFKPEIYAACPSIRYCNGWYYIIYLRTVVHGGKRKKAKYVSFISRTKDFQSFQDFEGNQTYGKKVQVFSPDGYTQEDRNNSDVDYFGSMEQLFQEYWPI